MDIGLRLAVVLALVAANGFFVAAEFALVTARKARIEQLAARGNRAAMAVRRALDDPNRFISACQLGITMASLALGWIGETTVATLIESPLSLLIPGGIVGLTSHAIAIPAAFAAITFLHITLGEQVPKMLALQKGEASALVTVLPTNFMGFVFRPFIALLYAFTDVVLRMFGMRWRAEMHQSYTADDLKLIIQSSRAAGAMRQDRVRMVERALDFAQLAAHHVMVPRTEMIAVPSNVSLAHLAEVMQRHQHSRYPVYEGSPDNIIGVLGAKRLAVVLAAAPAPSANRFDVRTLMGAPLFVPETMHADKLLGEMKHHRSHLAIVVDEYGATAGLVTLRDLMDRIAGEVPDEAESAAPAVQWMPDGSAIVEGLTLLPDVEAELGIQFGESEYDTLGGFIFGRLGRRPSLGDTVEIDGRTLVVEELDGLRVSRVRLQCADTSGEHAAEEPPGGALGPGEGPPQPNENVKPQMNTGRRI